MDIRKAHFIGIGGVGMSATAKLLLDAGAQVTGSDEEVYAPVSDFLRAQHIEWKSPYAATNIPADADAIIIGKNAKLVAETNAEVAAAFASGKKIFSFPDVLAQMSAGKETIVVAGSYGKSTSSALLAHCLEVAGKDPSYFIGAMPVSGLNAKAGRGALFIIEGDEYPASNTDPRSKFLLMHGKHALIVPLAHDHFNIFSTPADYLKPFKELVDMLPAGGVLAVCTKGPLSSEVIEHCHAQKRQVITYGVGQGDMTAANIVWGEKTSFDIVKGGKALAHIETSLLGEHNIQNIVGVAALILSLGLMSPEIFARGVASFKGLKRRLDRKSEKTSIPIFEGFGSSYEKARAAIMAIKRHFASRRLLVIFEPNTFSWRNRASLPQYKTVFEGADAVYVFEPPHDGKDTQLSLEEIVAQVQKTGVEVEGFAEPAKLLVKLGEVLASNDAILLLSSGPLGGLIEAIPTMAEQKFPQ